MEHSSQWKGRLYTTYSKADQFYYPWGSPRRLLELVDGFGKHADLPEEADVLEFKGTVLRLAS